MITAVELTSALDAVLAGVVDSSPRVPGVAAIATNCEGNIYEGAAIDRRNGVGGFWATQIFPFADPTSVGGYLDFEAAVYGAL